MHRLGNESDEVPGQGLETAPALPRNETPHEDEIAVPESKMASHASMNIEEPQQAPKSTSGNIIDYSTHNESPAYRPEQIEKGAFNFFASPGIWALVSSFPLMGKAAEFNKGMGRAGSAAFALASGAALLLTIFMLECTFWHLAPEDAEASVCEPSLVGFSMIVMMICVSIVPPGASAGPDVQNSQKTCARSAILPALLIGIVITTNMSGCALHHIAPEDVGPAICGPFALLSVPAQTIPFTSSSAHRSITTTKTVDTRVPAKVVVERVPAEERGLALAREQVEAEIRRKRAELSGETLAKDASSEGDAGTSLVSDKEQVRAVTKRSSISRTLLFFRGGPLPKSMGCPLTEL